MGRARSVEEEAALWVVRRADPAWDASLQQVFEAWLTKDPLHVEVYASLDATWRAADRAVPALRQRRRWRGVAGALLVLLLLGGLGRVGMGFDQMVQAAPGVTHALTLQDGTQLALNAGSAAVVRMGWWSRTITLLRGEALFEVADDRRKFEVNAAGARLVDIGTRFNVRLEGSEGEATVLEGAVEITVAGKRTLLHAGQRSRFDAQRVGPAETMHIAADAWLSGRWIFEAAPLAEVARELMRYPGVRVQVSPGLADLRVSGVFRTGDRDGLLKALAGLYPLRIESRDGTLWILPRG